MRPGRPCTAAFGVNPGRTYRKTSRRAREWIDTGDQVFVDKFSYNFIKPRRGDVFVFRTDNIPMITGDVETGQPFYIKRLVGLAGDTLRIDPPRLFINDKPAEDSAMASAASSDAKYPYMGYSSGARKSFLA